MTQFFRDHITYSQPYYSLNITFKVNRCKRSHLVYVNLVLEHLAEKIDSRNTDCLRKSMGFLKISTSFFVLVVMNAMIDFCLAEDSAKGTRFLLYTFYLIELILT